jgi:uncharacterized protein
MHLMSSSFVVRGGAARRARLRQRPARCDPAQRPSDRMARRVHEESAFVDGRHAWEAAMRIAITGGTGFIGSALHAHFEARGDEVLVVTRSPPTADRAAIGWDPAKGAIDAASLDGIDVAINLAGASIASPWTPGHKRRIRESRVKGTTLLAETLARLQNGPRVLLSGSAMGYYGDRGAQPITERDAPGRGFLAEVAVEWEAATKPAEDAGVRVVHTRFANVLSPTGGMLHTLLPFFKVGLGARFGDGRFCWPWIALEDVPHIAEHLIAHDEIHGAVNVVAPERVTNDEFTRAVAGALRRPSFLSIPRTLAKLAPGGMAEELVLGGACLVPKVLLGSGYRFRQPELRAALEAMLNDTTPQPDRAA